MNQFTTSWDFYIGVFTQSGPKAAVGGSCYSGRNGPSIIGLAGLYIYIVLAHKIKQ